MATAELQGHSCMQSLFGKHLERVSLAKEAFFFFFARPPSHFLYPHGAHNQSFFCPRKPISPACNVANL